MPRSKCRICFVTGTRAEFGLMRKVLRAIAAHRRLELQIIATGMHLDARHGKPLAALAGDDFPISAIVPWPAGSGRTVAENAANTGKAIASLAQAFERLRTDVVLLVGDRVEAFAAAVAGHLAHIPVAHVHGGDRALGQIDDSLRHAITKLSHVHFPATKTAAQRIRKLGEESWRIQRVGSPGVDGIRKEAVSRRELVARFPGLMPGRFALLVLHPADADAELELRRAEMVLKATRAAGFEQIVIIYPNNDPGCDGIIECWEKHRRDRGLTLRRDVPRSVFLGLLRDCAVLAGNSSAGIIEAASFHTPVLDIGPRQAGRERSRNVVHCKYEAARITSMLRRIWNGGRPRRSAAPNVYEAGAAGAGARIATILGRLPERSKLLRKLIRY